MYIYLYIYICIYLSIYLLIHLYTYVSLSLFLSLSLSLYIYTYIYVLIYKKLVSGTEFTCGTEYNRLTVRSECVRTSTPPHAAANTPQPSVYLPGTALVAAPLPPHKRRTHKSYLNKCVYIHMYIK